MSFWNNDKVYSGFLEDDELEPTQEPKPTVKVSKNGLYSANGIGAFDVDVLAGGGGATWGSITGTLSKQTDLKNALNSKVNKVSGKGLSTNDYTNEDKTKVASALQPSDLDDYALKTDLDDYAKTEDVPTQLAQLTSDSTHRVVTDAEKSTWNGKSDVVISSVSNITPTQVATAISQGKTVVITVSDDVDFGSLSFEAWNVSTSFGRVISNTTARLFNSWVTISLQGNLSTDSWELVGENIASLRDVDGKVDISQGYAHAGEFLVVGNDGNVTTRTLSAWQGGSY